MCGEHHQHRPHTENVVLELGDELGALVVYTDSALLHEEIEISRSGDDARRSHKDVLERRVNGTSIHAAVFDRLEHGAYTLWHRGEPFARGVAIAGGRVAELDGRTPQPTSSPYVRIAVPASTASRSRSGTVEQTSSSAAP